MIDHQPIEGFRLSPQQKRLWLLQEKDGTYWTQSSFLIQGELDRSRLRDALQRAAGRHEVFRTVFQSLAGMDLPIQRVLDEMPVAYAEVDLPRAAVGAEDVEELLRRDRQEDLDLERGPLVRVTLARLAPDSHLLCLTTPTLCGDARTHRNLAAEAERLYDRAGIESLGEVVQYVDFSEWQHELLGSEEAAEGRAFWRAQVPAELPGLPVEDGRPRDAAFVPRGIGEGEGAGVGARLAPEIQAALAALAGERKVSPEVVLLAAWLVLLARLGRHGELCVGRMGSGRKYQDLAGAHGLFARYFPLLFRIEPGHRFTDVLAQAERALAQAEEWLEYLSWDDLLPGDDARLPFCFEYQEPEASSGTRLSPLRGRSRLDRFALQLRAAASREGLELELEHDAALVEPGEAERLLERFRELLASALETPSARVSDLRLLGEADRRLIAAWNDTAVEAVEKAAVVPAPRRFEAQAARTPAAEAVVDDRLRLTYAELNARANRLARHLVRRGLPAGGRVVIALPRSAAQIVTLLAAWKAGAAFVPVDPQQPVERLARILEDVSGDGTPVLVVTTSAVAPQLPLEGSPDLPVVLLDRDEDALAAESAADPDLEVPPEAPAYLLFTSGSTGRPKGVVIRHAAVVNLAEALRLAVYGKAVESGAPLRVSVNAPLAFDASIKQIVQLLYGHAIYIVPEEVRPDGAALLDYVRNHRLDVLDCTPSQLSLLLAAGLLDDGGGPPRLTLVGGEKIEAELWQRLSGQDGRVFFNVYGPTECTVDTTVERIGAVPFPSLGRPLANVRAHVMDEGLQPVPPGTWGELLVGGAGLALGYAGRPDLTAERFVPDPAAAGARLYRTGDRVRLLPGGQLEFLGRIDLQVKLRGYRIELGEIEAVLREHPGVSQAVAVVREPSPGDLRLAAYVVPRRRQPVEADGRSRRELPNGMVVVEQNRNETEYLYREIFAERCYLRGGVELPDDACVIDVGANIGMFTMFVHQECSRPRVYSFEPLPPIFEALRSNCDLHAAGTVLFPFGLSDAERAERFTFYPRYTMMSGQSRYAQPESEVEVVKRYLENQEAAGATGATALLEEAEELLAGRFEGEAIEARLRRLSDVLREAGIWHVDLLKIDVQRAELDVLRGIDEEDWPKIDQVVLEVHDAPGDETAGRVAEILDLLERRGFDAVAEQDVLLRGTDRHNLYAVRRGLQRRARRAARRSEPASAADLSEAGLRDFLRQRLPDPMVPASVTLIDRLPLTRNGKVDRAALPAPESLAAVQEVERAAPRTPFEEVLAAIWAEVLGVPRVGRDESFFDLGGHSLLATQLMSRVRAALQVDLPLRALFEGPTVAALASQAETAFRGPGTLLAAPAVAPATRADRLPLSFAQQRLWFLHQLDPADPTYNNPKVLAFHGRLRVDRLAAALAGVSRRHEALRTRFPSVDGEPVQRIEEAAPVPAPIPVVDLAGLPEAVRHREARRLALSEAARPFDLARDLPLRVALLRLEPDEHRLLFTLHHIASDAWSLGVLVRELSALYLARPEDGPPALPELPVQYADYAVWQRSWLRGEILDAHLDFWRRQLAGLPPVLALPVDRPRSAVRTHRGVRERLTVPPALAERFAGLARGRGSTLFMVLLAAFQVFLSRISGEEDLAVGTPVSGRDQMELEGLIGLFLNTLVLRGDLRGEPGFDALLARTREAALAAYAHQALPFEILVDDLQPERSLSHSPLFQVLFTLQSVPREDLDLPGLRMTAGESGEPAARFDLALGMEELDGGLIADFLFSADLFDRPTALRQARQFRALLESLAADPGQRIGAATLLGSAERWQLLGEWNDTARTVPGVAVQRLFEARAERTPEAVALAWVDGERIEELTCADLDRRANRIAHHLIGLGIGPESRVGLSLERSPDMVAALLAVLKAGAAYVPLDPDLPRERRAWMEEDGGLSLVLTREELERQADRLAMLPAHRPVLPEPSGESLAYVLFTSGSTGRPKGVAVPHSAVVNFLGSMAERPGLHEGETLLAVTTLSFDIAVLELLLPLAVGACVALVSRETAMDGARLAAALASSGAEVMQATPATWRALLDSGWQGGAGFRALCGGEALPADLAARLLAGCGELWNLYGPTETTVWSTVERIDPSREVAIGRPIANTSVHLLDRGLEPVPPGVAGELYIGGAGVARGYVGRPDLTAERFVPDPFAERPGSRLYRVGDLARRRHDGSLEFLGRVDHQIKVRGFRIEPGEVEAALSGHGAVIESVVVARPDSGTHRLVAYVVAGETCAPAELRTFLEERLPAYMVPSVFVQLESLPRTPNGKVDRRGLPEPEVAADGSAAPRTPLEELVAGVWAEVLGLDRVGVHDSFFDLGGHSLLATRVMARLRRLLRVDLPLRALFEAPTVAGLAAAVERARRVRPAGIGPERPPLVRAGAEARRELSYAQQRLWFLDQLEPDSAVFNVPMPVLLEGRLDVAALERSLEAVVARHEVLRTRFPMRAGRPVQEIDPPGRVMLPVVDLSGLAGPRRRSETRTLARSEAARPFDLAHGPLFRMTLLRLGPEEHGVLATVHHIASDGWSMEVLHRDLGRFYEAFRQGSEPRLPELPVQYADYAAWQRAWLESGGLAEETEIWRRRLSGAPEVLELPSDRPRPAVRSQRGGFHPLTVPAALHESLRALGRREGATPFMMLLTGFAALLGRHAGDDVVVGTPVAGRQHVELEDLIGFFVNTLVLRIPLAGEPSFLAAVGRVREVVLEAHDHQELPFDKLVEELRPQRSLSNAPLFQVMFVLTPEGRGENGLGDLRARPLIEGSSSATAQFDLTLALTEREGRLDGLINYSLDLFDSPTVVRLARHLELLLEGVVADPDRALAELPLLDEVERHQVLCEWNDTAVPGRPRHARADDLFRAQARRHPEATALIQGESRLSYAELDRWSDSVARRLRSLGVGPESRVGLLADRSFARVAGLLGILKAGGAALPLDPSHPDDRLAYMLADSEAAAVVARPDLARRVPAGLPILLVDGMELDTAEVSPAEPLPLSLAYVIYTSGSTGQPKASGLAHAGLCNFVETVAALLALGPGDGFLQFAAPGFDASVGETFLALGSGAALCLPEESLLPGADLAAMMRRTGVTALVLPPSALAALPEEELPGVRIVLSAGEACTGELRDRWSRGRWFFNAYGPSEASISATLRRLQPGGRVDMGVPLANFQAYMVDRRGLPVSMGAVGELCLGGVGLSRGYLARPEMTADRFIPDPFGPEPGGRLYRTGDLARFLPDGHMEFLGRIDHQVKVRGYRIELGEIESVLGRHERVLDAVVLAREGAGAARLVAYVVPRPGADAPSAGELRAHLGTVLPEYMVPSAFVALERLPLLANGKVDRKALPEPVRTAGAGSAAPRDTVEELLAGLWAEALGIDGLGIDDDVFELGAHSLLVTRVASRIREALRVELPLRDLFEAPTVAGLAERIGRALAAPSGAPPPLVPVPREGGLPLSFGQERMWFLNQLEPDSPAYNLPIRLRQTGRLGIADLARSFGEIVRRHEVLRTRFAVDGAEARQWIEPAAPVTLPVVDLGRLPEPARGAEARRLAVEEARRPFRLEREPAFRVRLVRLAGDDYLLLVTLHHIASDGWSLGILTREVKAHYAALTLGEPVRLPELPVQYADFAVWQRRCLEGSRLDEEVAWWRERLDGLPPVLSLPVDRPRPPVRSHRGEQVPLAISSVLAGRVAEAGRRAGATPFMVLLAVLQALLGRLSGQDDLAVGTPVAGRDRLETEGLIGFFVNTLVLRGGLRGEPGFGELLERAREVSVSAFAHQAVPFELLVDRLQPQRSLSYSPLFQVLFALQDVVAPESEGLPGLAAVAFDAGAGTGVAKFDLSLSLTLAEPAPRGALEYSSDLFDRPTALRMAGYFTALLDAFAADPGLRVGDAPLLAESELHQVLVEWNDTHCAIPGIAVQGAFEACADRAPGAPAVAWVEEGEGEELTYGELEAWANRVAHLLRGLGIGPESRVGLCLERSPEMLAALLGVLKSGAAYVPLDPDFPRQRLAWMVEDGGLSLVLTREPLLDRLEGARTLCLDRAGEALLALPASRPPLAVLGESAAYVLFTSGSTGRPKGVAVCHAALAGLFGYSMALPGLHSGATLLAVSTLSFDIAALELLLPLSVGARVALVSRDTVLDSARLAAALARSGARLMHAVPSVWRALVDSGWDAGPDFRVWCGGEALSGELAVRLLERGCRVWNFYGPTEATIWSTMQPVSRTEALAGIVAIGRPIANTAIHLLDPRLEPVPAGVPGELWVGGAGVARGYVGRPDLTAERFIPDPFGSVPGGRLYRTGDLARRRYDGIVEYLGRVDHQVKVRGLRIELGEIESALSRHGAVAEAAAAVWPDGAGAGRLVAYVAASEEIAAAELRAFLSERLPGYMIPSLFVPLTSLPRTPNGKVDRRALPEPRIAATASVAPRTPQEELVADLWAEVLGLERVGAHDNFFELGGHSLLATRVMSRLRQALGVDLPLRTLFEAPTVAGLAAAAERSRRAGQGVARTPLVRAARDGRLELSYAQQRLWFIDQLEPGSALYNLPMSVLLDGPLDVPALERSLAAIVARHEVLRTRFPTFEGRPAQEIEPAGGLRLPVVDLGGLPEPRRLAEARDLARQEAGRPFDLARGPVFRSSLLRLGAEEHGLLATMHHIASDGWSMGVLRRELGTFYRQLSRGEEPRLPELPVQYADYAAWQRAWLETGGLAAATELWRRRLAGAPEALDLPLDRPRPAVQGASGAMHPIEWPADLHESLRHLGRREGGTLFMTVLAGFMALLERYAGDDVVVGTPVAGRQHVELENLIGFFVNTLVLRVSLAGAPPFREAMARVRGAVLEAHENQELPFEKLVDELQPQRSLRHSPLFQVLFVLQAAETAEAGLPGLRARTLPGAGTMESARFDLTLSLVEGPAGISGFLNYRTDLFERATAVRLEAQLRSLLAGAVAEPWRPAADLPLLGEAERHALVVEWNDSSRPEPSLLFHQRFARQAELRPEAAATRFGGETLSYREVAGRANRLARHLRRLGVRPEVRVGLCLERSPDFLIAVLGVLQAGGAYVPLDPSSPAERRAWVLEDALGSQETILLVSRGALADELEGAVPRLHILRLDADGEAVAGEREEPYDGGAGPGNLAYVIYTSGSTGRPKGVAVPHRGLANLWDEVGRLFDGSGERILQFFSPAFDGSLWELASGLATGACLCFEPQESLLPWPRQLAVNAVTLPPSALAVLSPEGLPELRTLVVAGEACPPDVARRWSRGRRLLNGYGPTEATICVSTSSFREDLGVLPLGRPLANARLLVLDARLRPAPVGAAGELYIGGPGLARGYLGRPDLTAERFLPDPLAEAPGERLYRTGDLARRLPDGDLEFRGRIDHQVKIRGFRIETGEIEAALGRHPGLREAAVVLREDLPGGRGLAAYVTASGDAAPEPGELRVFLSRTLPDYMVPSVFVALDRLPLLASGKVDRKALPAPASGRSREPVSPRNRIEELLAGIWAEVLRVDRVGVYDNFFELGGDSILSIQIVARANEAGLSLTPKQLFQHQTVATLAEIAGEATFAPAASAEQGPVFGPMPLTPIQRWFFGLGFVEPHHFNQSVMVRVLNPIEPSLVSRAFAELLRHHDVLRTRFECDARGQWRAHGVLEAETAFLHVDLSALPEERRPRGLEEAAARAQASLDLARGPLARMLWFDLGASSPARLLMVIHHLVVDGVSWRILLADLVRACRQLEEGQEPRLAPKTTSFKAWAERLDAFGASPEIRAEEDYWHGVLQAALPLPVDFPNGRNSQAAARTLTVSLDEAETRSLLQEVPAACRARINDILLTALAQTLAEWTGEPPLVGLEGHGREELFPDVDLSRTVGWFTLQFPLRLPVGRGVSTGEALKRVKEALRAVPRNGIGYGLQTAVSAGPQVGFNYLGQLDQVLPESSAFGLAAESTGPAWGGRERRPFLLDVNAHVAGGRLLVRWGYSRDSFRDSTVEILAARYAEALRGLIAHSRSDEAGALTPSDVPLLRWSQEALDRTFPHPRNIEDAYPLSPLQAGMLMYALGAPDSAVYVEQMSYTLAGDLDADALVRSFGELVARHTVLRTSFLWEGVDEPIQVVHRQVDLPVQRLSWAGLPSEEQDRRLEELVQSERRRGFDLSCPPLARVALVEAAPGLHQVIWTTHHLVGDGWSLPILVRELLTLYETARLGTGPAFEPARPFREHIEWVAGQDPTALEAFWRRELAGFTAPTPLGVDRPAGRPGQPAHGDERLRLTREATASLESLARGWKLTLNTLVQGAWALLLSRYSGHDDVVFGITVSGRPAELRGAEAMVGPFINTVPLRVSLPQEAGLLPWLEELQRHGLERQSYEYGGFVQPWSEVPMGLPLFESLLVFENYPRTPAAEVQAGAASDLQARGLQGVVRTRYALNLVVNPGAELGLYLSYDAHRLDAPAMRRMQEHLRNLLEAFMGDPHRTLGELPMLSEAERNQLQAGSEVLLLDRFGQPVPLGVAGQIHRPDPITAGPPQPTGEWARRTEDGRLEPLGRLEERVTVLGRTFWPRDAEAFLERHPETPRSLTQTEELLAGLWEEVLGVGPIGPRDSFLALGGNSLIATRLASRLRAALGIDLPLRTLFEAPTVAELARKLETLGGSSAQAPAIRPVPRDRNLPLSFAQQRLWFLDQLQPGDVAYNVPVAVRLTGRLDLEALRRTFAEILKRHESLRTVFPAERGQAVQRILPPSPPPLPVLDLAGLEATAREGEARRLAEMDARRPFDLERGPIVRLHLLRLDTDEHAILFCIHHIVSDAWSMSVLVQEMGRVYAAFAAGRPSPLPALPVQYADFAHWQRAWLDGEVLEEQLSYWTRHLGSQPPDLDLPADRPRNGRPGGRGRQVLGLLPAALSRDLAAFSRREGATLFMTMLAGFAALLARLCKRDDVVVGMPIAGRNRIETEGLIGFFVNILPLHLDLSRSPTFRELLRQAREATLGAFAHQDLPLEKLVEALKIERRQDRSPLFQVTFGLQNAPEASAELPGLSISPLPLENETVRFDLTVWVREIGPEVGIQWTYNADLFEPSTVERMHAGLVALLADAMADPDLEVERMALLSAADRERRVLEEKRAEQSRRSRLLSVKPRRMSVEGEE